MISASTMGEGSLDVELYDRLLSFVSSQTRTRRKLSLATELLWDLGVDGDDATDFIAEFQREFEVDLSDFDLGRHFGPEGFNLDRAISAWFKGRKVKAPISIGLLYRAAREHRWPSEDI